jgi:hypothetical protein
MRNHICSENSKTSQAKCIDTNRNLDILSSGDNQDWKIGIWLQSFNNPDLTQLKYSLMVSPSRQQELQEVAVKTTSVDGNVSLTNFSHIVVSSTPCHDHDSNSQL